VTVPLLEARGLDAGYGRTLIVRQLDLQVHSGEVVVLLGPNGAGKTTTLRTLAGDLSPLSGAVYWNGEPSTEALHRRARRGLAFISEERAIFSRLTVGENLRLSRGDSVLAYELFPELKAHRHRKAGALSGGQQQMLALVRALSREPSLILADELSLGLAPKVVDRLLDTVRSAADRGAGALVVEQHVHKALRIADRVYVMRRGTIQITGTAVQFHDRIEQVEAAYFGP
jgi:ABC-type branched-subunit amino acid transport system ATPase component